VTGRTTPLVGWVSPGFEQVRDAFIAAIATDDATGAALSIRHHGHVVVDLAGGVADPTTGRPWDLHTPSVIFSATKGIMSILTARLVQDGRLNFDQLMTDHWPAFGQAGKSTTRVGDALAHRAGLAAPRTDWAPADLLDWRRATALLSEQEPLWESGTRWAYHAITHGVLTGELVRRITGSMPGAYLTDLVTGPLGLDAWIGIPPEVRPRVAVMQVGQTLMELSDRQRREAAAGRSDLPLRALTLGGALPLELVGKDSGFNRADFQAAEIPGAGGIATAHALATIWSAVVTDTSGMRLLDDDVIRNATLLRSGGDEAPAFDVPGPWPRWGAGFQLDSAARRYLGPSSLGHDGAGGQVAFADLDARVGFAFVTNRMEAGDDRATEIVRALRSDLTG
jgi:CubicO group peptidase (beta-lactamase class C family)